MTPHGVRSPPASPSSAPRGREARAIRAGLLASAVLHLLVILIYSALTGVSGDHPSQGASDPDLPDLIGMEIVVLLEREEAPVLPTPVSAPPSLPVSPEPTPPAVEDRAEVEPEPSLSPPAPEDRDADEELTLAERLQPRMGDPRVWASIPADFADLTEFERAEILLRGMLQSYNDSVAIAAALSERASDWTYTDASGRRWGLAAGRLYLGDFSIPLPAFEFAPGLIEDRLDAQATQADLARAAAAAQLRETWTDRARIIREQMEIDRLPPPPPRSDEGTRGG